MSVSSNPGLNIRKVSPLFSDRRAIAPILQLSRICCILVIGAGLFIAIDAFVYRRIENPSLYVQGLDSLLVSLALLMLAGAVFCGVRIIRQARVDASRSAELLQQAKQRTTEIAALYDISQDMSVQYHLPVILQGIVERAKTLLGTSGCAIFLYDRDHNDFQIAVEVGVGMPIGTHLPLNEGLAGRVAQTLEPLIVNDYHNWPQRASTLKRLPIGAAICVPMIRGGELVGVLGVHEGVGTKREFTEAEARLLSLFATNAAGAVQNARLLDALKESEERFRIAAECASDIVYDWDLSADCVEYFGAAYKRARAGAETLPGTRQEYWSRVHPEDRERVQSALNEHLAKDRPFSEEYRILNENGSYIDVSDRATAIKNPSGKPIKLVGAVSNITERKHAEKMKTDFVSFVSHQLRTPLSGVKWMLELAMDGTVNPEDMRSYIQDARTATDRLIGLVNDLLDISRMERGKLEIAHEKIDLADLTRCVIKEISPLVLEKGQSLTVKPAADLPQLTSDPQLVRQVIINLTSNAMKYTQPGGAIEIRLNSGDHRIFWEIQDNGIGIPKRDLRRLFEKFYRAENVLAVETEGTGLGLYLVRLIVERLGGNVVCESVEGIGSTFRFALPLDSEKTQ